MNNTPAQTPDEYIAALPDARRATVAAVRDVVRRNLPDGFEEGMLNGIIGWYVPLERFPNTYNGQPLALGGLASQKNYISLYLNSVYGNRDTEGWFQQRYAQSGKKLNMGKSCLRFRQLDELPLELIGETFARTDLAAFLRHYEAARGSSRATRAAGARGT